MKTVGIIAEYNPFHNGHLYQIEESRRQTGADYVIVAMSGDYTQRGMPAIYNKYRRTAAALYGGADLVLELPIFGAVSPAADFAKCGVATLLHTGAVDMLCFGSECGDLDVLKKQAELAFEETAELSEEIKRGLKKGLTWPQAQTAAYQSVRAAYRPVTEAGSSPSLPVSSPNDILAVEYLRAMKRLGTSIKPFTIKRKGTGYHSMERIGGFSSATAARAAIFEGQSEFLKTVLPDAYFMAEAREPAPALCFNDFTLILNEKLLSSSREIIASIASMPNDLADKLYRERLHFMKADDLAGASKDRQYTYSRVSRCLLNLTLGITKVQEQQFKSLGSAPWLRILGFKRNSGPLLSEIKKNATAPIITKVADAKKRFEIFDEKRPATQTYGKGQTRTELFAAHLRTSELYRMIAEQKTGKPMRNEFTRQIMIL